jgi:hypothetical protein
LTGAPIQQNITSRTPAATGDPKMREKRQVDEMETRVIRGLKKSWFIMKIFRKSRRLAKRRNHGGPVVIFKEALVKRL